MEGGMLLVAAPAAVSGLNSYSRNCQEVNKVFWDGVNKNNLVLRLTLSGYVCFW